jgi:two-component system LytT family response regulator
MSRTDAADWEMRRPGAFDLRRLARELAFGFAYWLTFVLVLEPGHIAHAIRSGAPLTWDQEVLRLTGAGLLGAVANPPFLAFVRRFPIEGPSRWRRAALHLAGSAATSVVLVASSCVLAAWFLTSEHRPFAQALWEDMVGNVMLLTFCFAGLVAILHAARFSRSRAPSHEAAAGAQPATHAPKQGAVKTRAGLLMLEADSIDWVETQGNYLALHVGRQTHLIRETSRRFEAMLDPDRFARVHRQTIVAVERVREIAPLGSGDATLRLDTGAELRLSRSYRGTLQARLARPPS